MENKTTVEYNKGEAEVIKFENEDIVTKSGNCGHKTSGQGGPGCSNKNHSNHKCKKNTYRD